MTILGVDTIAVVVSDRHKAIRWYRDVLGVEVAYIGPSVSNPDPTVEGTPDNAGHWIEMGPARPRTRLHLCDMGGETEPGPTGLTLITDDILADYKRLRGEGVHFQGPPRKMDWGEWICDFVDPDGNEIELKQPIDAGPWKRTARASEITPARRDVRRVPRRGRRKKPPRRTGRAS